MQSLRSTRRAVALLASGITLGLAAAPASAQLTRADAVAAVSAEIPVTAGSTMWCPFFDFGFGAGFEGLLPMGTTVSPVEFGVNPWAGNTVTLNNDGYFFFHELTPGGQFVHEVQYIYVDASDPTPTLAEGSIAVQSQGWWPVVTIPGPVSFELFSRDQQKSNDPAGPSNTAGLVATMLDPDSDILTSEANALPLMQHNLAPSTRRVLRGGTSPEIPGSNPAGIVVSGSGDADMDNDVDVMKEQMEGRGIPAGRIQSGKDLDFDEICTAIDNACNLMPAPDHLYVYIVSHGGSGSLCLDDGSLPLTDPDPNMPGDRSICALAKKLGEKCIPVDLYIQACNSGSLVSTIRPKIKQGVIITSAKDGESSISNAFRDGMGDAVFNKTRISLLMGGVLQCWSAKDGMGTLEADKPANGGDGDGKVSWGEAFRWVCSGSNSESRYRTGDPMMPLGTQDSKDPEPSATGLPRAIGEWCVFGVGYKSDKEDLDRDGKYDICRFQVDLDKDGNDDFAYTTQDKDEDGNPNLETCFLDADDDGIPEERVDIDDANDDGTPESTKRFMWDGNNWVLQIDAPLRNGESASVSPSNAPEPGGFNATIIANAGTNFDPTAFYQVFIGPYECPAEVADPFTMFILTPPGLPGVYDVTIVNFDDLSPNFGFIHLPDAFELFPVLPIPERLEPSQLHCGLPVPEPVQLFGRGFLGPPLALEIDGQPVPINIIDDGLIEFIPPLLPCGNAYDVVLIEQNGFDPFVLVGGLEVLPQPDVTPPQLIPPDPVVIGVQLPLQTLVPMPQDFQGTATDLPISGPPVPVPAQRLQEGALDLGLYVIDFVAWDAAGNFTTASSTIEIVPICPGDINTTGTTNGVPDGVTNVSDLQFFLTQWQNDMGATPGSIADVNTTGTTNGIPDGVVNLSDLQFFLNQWQSGISACP